MPTKPMLSGALRCCASSRIFRGNVWLLMEDDCSFMKPDRSQGLTCYVDADFAGNWTPDQALDPRACLSRTGFVIFCANCPIVWHSKLQTTISLSMTEAEYVALSTAMRDAIYFINLIQEIQDFGIKLPHTSKPKVTCRVFEDNVGALELANTDVKINHVLGS